MEHCTRCQKEFSPQNDGPVTVGGWYGSYEYYWNNGQLRRWGPYCDACKALAWERRYSYLPEFHED